MARISHHPNSEVKVDDGYLIALAKLGDRHAYDRLVRRYYGFVRLKASSYFLAGGDSDDLIQEGLVGLYKAVRDYRTDRESSFRNFAELCITRQIITAVKTATRNKHTPLNQYVSFSSSVTAASDGEPTLDEIIPGSPEDMASGLRALLDRVPEGGRGLAVSHTPLVERGAFGLTGREIEPLGECEGILLTLADDGTLTLEELRLA